METHGGSLLVMRSLRGRLDRLVVGAVQAKPSSSPDDVDFDK